LQLSKSNEINHDRDDNSKRSLSKDVVKMTHSVRFNDEKVIQEIKNQSQLNTDRSQYKNNKDENVKKFSWTDRKLNTKSNEKLS